MVHAGAALALIFGFFIFNSFLGYARMAWKVAGYNSLRHEADDIRMRYRVLQKRMNQTSEQLASLELLAKEVSVTYGINPKKERTGDLAAGDKLVPTFSETVAEYNQLRDSNLPHLAFVHRGHTHVQPEGWPVVGALVSSFGERTDPFSGEGAYHTGVDISAPFGTPTLATADGVVVLAGRDGGYGRLVVVDHGNGYQTYYAHLSRFYVGVGQDIRQGEPVGEIGASGRVTAAHLHYEVRLRKAPVNPYRYLVANARERGTRAHLLSLTPQTSLH